MAAIHSSTVGLHNNYKKSLSLIYISKKP